MGHLPPSDDQGARSSLRPRERREDGEAPRLSEEEIQAFLNEVDAFLDAQDSWSEDRVNAFFDSFTPQKQALFEQRVEQMRAEVEVMEDSIEKCVEMGRQLEESRRRHNLILESIEANQQQGLEGGGQ